MKTVFYVWRPASTYEQHTLTAIGREYLQEDLEWTNILDNAHDWESYPGAEGAGKKLPEGTIWGIDKLQVN